VKEVKDEASAIIHVINRLNEMDSTISKVSRRPVLDAASCGPLAQYVEKRYWAGVRLMLDSLAGEIEILGAELRSNGYKPSSPRPDGKRDILLAVQTTGGFYTVLHMLAVAVRNLSAIAQPPQNQALDENFIALKRLAGRVLLTYD